jgi:signal transduction histidine kinase
MSTRNDSGPEPAPQVRSSLVQRLNARLAGRLLAGFMAINLLILFLGSAVIFWSAESDIRGIIRSGTLSELGSRQDSIEIGPYRLTAHAAALDSYRFPDFVQKWLNRDVGQGVREIGRPPADQPRDSVFKQIRTLQYALTMDANGPFIQISFAIGQSFHVLIVLLIVLLALEMLFMIRELVRGPRRIRQILQPLYALADAARTLNAEVSSLGPPAEDRQIEALAGVISRIDASRLDRRISVDSAQDELKGLAAAINDMLNRIDQSYQSQVRFVSDASHELRTPISVIQGYVNLLDRWGKNDEKTLQESIDAIKSETQSMKELVEQLLFLARGDNETIQLHRETFDVCEVVDEIAREAQMIDPAHHVETSLQRPALIFADKPLIKQAIRILVDNSIKYTPDGETITLKVAVDPRSVRITVQDNGIGIAPESIPLVFNRFYRSDESRTRKTGGAGLGLSIAKWIMERHGAHFEVLSRVGMGTRITMVMPVPTKPEDA